MTSPLVPAPDCAGCAFWRKQRENEGLCCRHAPEASTRPEEVAHWPHTRSRQWCGEGVAATQLPIRLHCADCVFWRHPDGGLNPVDRGDMQMLWWTHAGVCARHAPRPDTAPGPRGFWRATKDVDFCGDGVARENEPTSPSPRGVEQIDAALQRAHDRVDA